MALPVTSVLDFEGRNRITNLAAAVAAGQPVTYEQFQAGIAGISWKDDVVVAAPVNVTIASPGATMDGRTLSNGNRVLLLNQTTASQNGIYIFNGATTPLTRALDSASFEVLENAVVPIKYGSSAGVQYRQTQVGGVIGTDSLVFTLFMPASPDASTTTKGILEIATQAEVDAGTDSTRALTPATLAAYSGGIKRYFTTIGDGTATSFTITHNLGSDDVDVYVRESGGLKREIMVEKQHTSTNSVTLVWDVAPATSSVRVRVSL